MSRRRKTEDDDAIEAAPQGDESLSPAPPSTISVEGIDFADEPLPEVKASVVAKEAVKASGGGSGIHDHINTMRKNTVNARKRDRENIGVGANTHKPRVEPVSEEVAKAALAKKFRVVESSPPVRAGGRTFNLYAGKVIDENNYDIAHLRASGVKLERIVEG